MRQETFITCTLGELHVLINKNFKNFEHKRDWNLVADFGAENYKEIFVESVKINTSIDDGVESALLDEIACGHWPKNALPSLLKILCKRNVIVAGSYIFLTRTSDILSNHYGANVETALISASVPASEHSIQCAYSE